MMRMFETPFPLKRVVMCTQSALLDMYIYNDSACCVNKKAARIVLSEFSVFQAKRMARKCLWDGTHRT